MPSGASLKSAVAAPDRCAMNPARFAITDAGEEATRTSASHAEDAISHLRMIGYIVSLIEKGERA